VAIAAGLLCTAAAVCISLLCCCSCASCEFRPVSAWLPAIRPGCACAAIIASGLDAAIAPMPPIAPIAPIMPPDWFGLLGTLDDVTVSETSLGMRVLSRSAGAGM
jgi:hypothetical protein